MGNIKNITDAKGKIFLTARRLFIEKGVDSTSIREIAAACDTNVAMVNYYFESKYKLFELIFDDSLEALTSRMFEVLLLEVPIWDLVEKYVNSYYEILLRHPEIPIFILREISRNPERLTQRIKSRKPYEIYLHLSKRIDEEAAKGIIKPMPAIDLLLNILSLCVFPFIFGRFATNSANRSQGEYDEVLLNHKQYVIEFIKNALSP